MSTTKKFKVRTPEQLKADNARFEALTPLNKRVAVAKEVLLQMRTGALFAGWDYGSRIDFRGRFVSLPQGDLQKGLNKEGIQCVGCAKGAAVIARATLGDGVRAAGGQAVANRVTYEIFGRLCGDLLECLYEGESWGGPRTRFATGAQAKAFRAYQGKLPYNRQERMIAIYQNIVANRGRLKIGRYKF